MRRQIDVRHNDRLMTCGGGLTDGQNPAIIIGLLSCDVTNSFWNAEAFGGLRKEGNWKDMGGVWDLQVDGHWWTRAAVDDVTEQVTNATGL